jgi:hypothetical protein
MKHSKSSHLNERIEMLNMELTKTGVTIIEDDKIFVSKQKEIVEEDSGKIDWRKDLLKEENNPIDEEIDLIREDFKIKNNSLKRVDGHIKNIDKDFLNLRQEIFQEISEDFLFNIPSIEQKIDKVLKIYDSIQEGLLNEPPSTKNSDPLTPLDQNFVTIGELNNHYKLFINRIQEQIATVGGGGEYRLKYLDDIVGIATNASSYDGKFLSYNHSIKKFEFVGAAFTSSGATGIGVSIGDTPPVDTVMYPLWFDNQSGRSFIYYTDQDGSQWVDFSPSTSVGNKTSYWVETSVGIHTLSNVGIGTTNPSAKLEVQNGDIRVGIDTSQGLILTSPNGTQFRLIVDNLGILSTVGV